MRVGRVVAAGVALSLVGVALSACAARSPVADRLPGAHAQVTVVAAENFWGDIAGQIGGTGVDVSSIITDPNTDPHEYETSAADARAVARADLVIENGVGYDDFVDKLVNASRNGSRHVIKVEDVVHPAESNPHLWYDPAYVEAAAHAIEAQLAALAPESAATFAANLREFLAAEQQVDDVVEQIKAKHAGTAVGYTERVAGYLVEAAGLRLGTPASFARAIEDGDDPSPRDTIRFRLALQNHTVAVLLYNAQVTSPATAQLRALAEREHIPVVGVTETMPSGAVNFQSWQAGQAQALLAALGG